jgi:glutaconate CoA-transferase subunit A
MAHAAKATLVTVERICESSLLADENSAAGVLPALYYVTAIAQARNGA